MSHVAQKLSHVAHKLSHVAQKLSQLVSKKEPSGIFPLFVNDGKIIFYSKYCHQAVRSYPLDIGAAGLYKKEFLWKSFLRNCWITHLMF
jgi:hypothetical protein